MLWKDLRNDRNSSLSLKPSPNLELFIENSSDPEKNSSSTYYDIEEMHNIQIPHKTKWLSLFHINLKNININKNSYKY